jgi:hypothetical protein
MCYSYVGKQGFAVKTIFLQFCPFVIAGGKRTGQGQEKDHLYNSSTHRNKWLSTGNPAGLRPESAIRQEAKSNGWGN